MTFGRYWKMKKTGHISIKSELGRWIQLLSSLSSVETIVEIGTWNGRGSSSCITGGVNMRRSTTSTLPKVIGYEIDAKKFSEAQRYLKKYPWFEVVYGSLVEIEQLDEDKLNLIEEQWLASDVEKMKLAPIVLESLPSEIDLLILDGGEFSTVAEFELIHSRVKNWLILDDVKTRKGRRIIVSTAFSNNFEIIHQSDERNGILIAKRR